MEVRVRGSGIESRHCYWNAASGSGPDAGLARPRGVVGGCPDKPETEKGISAISLGIRRTNRNRPFPGSPHVFAIAKVWGGDGVGRAICHLCTGGRVVNCDIAAGAGKVWMEPGQA